MRKQIFIASLGMFSLLAPTPRHATAGPTTQPVYMDDEGPGDLTEVKGRVGGAQRGSSVDAELKIAAVSPESVGKTASASPTLFFYLSKATTYQVEVVVTEQKNRQAPSVRIWTSADDSTVKAGLHEINLAELRVTLKPNVLYRWSAVIRVDPNKTPPDIAAGGMIESVPAADANADPKTYFYDAVAAEVHMMRRMDATSGAAKDKLAGMLADAKLDKDVKLDAINDPEVKPTTNPDQQ